MGKKKLTIRSKLPRLLFGDSPHSSGEQLPEQPEDPPATTPPAAPPPAPLPALPRDGDVVIKVEPPEEEAPVTAPPPPEAAPSSTAAGKRPAPSSPAPASPISLSSDDEAEQGGCGTWSQPGAADAGAASSSAPVDTSGDEEFARRLFVSLNRDLIGIPGDGALVEISSDSEEEDAVDEIPPEKTPSP